MESLYAFAVLHWDYEPRTGETVPPKCCRRLVGRASLRFLRRQDAGSTLGFMESLHATWGAQRDHEPADRAVASWTAPVLWRFQLARLHCQSARRLAHSKTWRGLRRFMESGWASDADFFLTLTLRGRSLRNLCAHCAPELESARSAGFPACGFWRLSSRQSLVLRTGKSGKPAGWKAFPTFWTHRSSPKKADYKSSIRQCSSKHSRRPSCDAQCRARGAALRLGLVPRFPPPSRCCALERP